LNHDDIIKKIQAAQKKFVAERLTFKKFCSLTLISQRTFFNHFDSWSEACAEAGIECRPARENLIPNTGVSEKYCIAEMRRVAENLGRDYITQKEFDTLSKLHSCTPIRKFGTWVKALSAAELRVSPHAFETQEVPFKNLVADFMKVAQDLGHAPTLIQLSRRSKHGQYLFSKKHGGYPAFKSKVASYLLNQGMSIPDWLDIREEPHKVTSSEAPIRAHEHGRILGFRSIAHEPTYEQEVVGLFTLVADELGFEILCLREEFPDCEANRKIPGPRKRYKKCLIEFELRSSDYYRHKHPINGSDLVVCWLHDWTECPIEVLELKSAIRKLPGWK